MTPVSKFLNYILPSVPGCSVPLATQALVSAAREFCSRTNIIQGVLDPINVVAGLNEYDVDAPAEQAPVRVLDVWYAGQKLRPVAPDNVDNPYALRAALQPSDAPSGDPQLYYQVEPNSDALNVWPIPKVALAKGLTIRASFQPVRRARNLDDVLFEDWVDALAAGALAQLFAIPQQPFTDSKRVLEKAQQFSAGVNAAWKQGRTGNLRVDSRVQMRPFI